MSEDINLLVSDLEKYFLVCGLGLQGLTIVVPPPPQGGNVLADPGGNGLVVRTSLDVTVARTLTTNPLELSITNADALQGNPLFSFATAMSIVGKSLTVGDTGFIVQSLTGSGRRFKFDATGIADNTTLTFTLPPITDTLVGINAQQSLTNKTISGGSNTIQNIPETALALTDVTVGNASTLRHGFVPKLPNTGTAFLRDDGVFATPAGAGDTSTNTATSVANELVLFADTTGKLLKRATGSGLALVTSGVLSVSGLSTALAAVITDHTGTGGLVFANAPVLQNPQINAPAGLTKNDVGLNLVDNTSDDQKNSAIKILTNKTIDGSANTFVNIPATALALIDDTANNVSAFRHGFVPKLPGSTAVFFRGDGQFAGIAGGGDVTSNTGVSVVNEIALFADTTGKLVKRSTGSGLALLTSGVLSTITTSAALASALSDETGSGALVFATNPSLISPNILTPTGITKADVGLNLVDNTSDTTKQTVLASAVITFTNKRFVDRVVTLPDGVAITPTVDSADAFIHTNTQATGTLTINAPTGTPNNFESFVLRIKSTNQQTLSWNAIYRGGTTQDLPPATSGANKTDYFVVYYNSADSKYDVMTAAYGY